eukprot:5868037-Prymnesium_polylepis.1
MRTRGPGRRTGSEGERNGLCAGSRFGGAGGGSMDQIVAFRLDFRNQQKFCVYLFRGDKKVENSSNPCSGVSTSAPTGLNGLPRTVWTGMTHSQRLALGSVGKRIG